MRNLKVAIIGAGTAGLAAAAFLSRSGHTVTLCERFDAPKPVGAGLLLQPTGLSVLALLGLDRQVISAGSRIARLQGRVCGSRSVTLDVRYSSFSEHLFGLGVHRGSLFTALYDAVAASGATIIPAGEIVSIRSEGGREIVMNARGESFGPFDMVVDASGAKSALRKQHADVKLDKAYPYGAIWSIVNNTGGAFAADVLAQRYKHAYHMIGVLPVGRPNGGSEDRLAFFWSLKAADYPQWRERPLGQWQDYVASLWPEADVLLRQFASHDDLMLATYSDVILRKFHSGNIVFIGDAAHATSPQLGQGANLALMDAMVLAGCVAQSESVQEALHGYTLRRKKHIRFYQTASRMLTPFFQSDSLFFARLRFLTCGLACRIPFTRRIAAEVLSGTKTGLCSSINPGDWAEDYDRFRRSSNALIE